MTTPLDSTQSENTGVQFEYKGTSVQINDKNEFVWNQKTYTITKINTHLFGELSIDQAKGKFENFDTLLKREAQNLISGRTFTDKTRPTTKKTETAALKETADKVDDVAEQSVPKTTAPDRTKKTKTKSVKPVEPEIEVKQEKSTLDKMARTTIKVLTLPSFIAKRILDGVTKVQNAINEVRDSIGNPPKVNGKKLNEDHEIKLTLGQKAAKTALGMVNLTTTILATPFILAAIPYMITKAVYVKISSKLGNKAVDLKAEQQKPAEPPQPSKADETLKKTTEVAKPAINSDKAEPTEPEVKKTETPKLTDTHQVKKTLGKKIKETAIKAATIAGAVILSPILVPAALVTRGILALRELAITSNKDNLITASREMKAGEEVAKFEALKKTLTDVRFVIDKTKIQTELNDVKTKKNKLERILLRSAAYLSDPNNPNAPKPDTTAIKQFCQGLTNEDFYNEKIFKARIQGSSIETYLTDESISQLFRELKATNPVTDMALDKDLKVFEELTQLLKEKPTDYSKTNMLVTGKLRAFLQTDTYQALKENPENPLVKTAQRLACAIWNEVQALDSYKKFGHVTVKDDETYTSLEKKDNLDGKEMATILEDSRKRAAKTLFIDHGALSKMRYAVTHPEHALASMSSEGGTPRVIAEAFGAGEYDSHGTLSNNPSLQGATTFEGNGYEGTINNCYGGSPTIGDYTISPEFEAACQAAENKQFSDNKDKHIPDVIYYTNFQNIENKHGEGERSYTIMRLNDRFPYSFVGMTLPKDSNFYMMPERKDKLDSIEWKGAKAMADEMLEKMTHTECYVYAKRMGKPAGNGFYFPGGQKLWEKDLPDILKKAQKRFENAANCKGIDAYKLRGAFQEYVYSLIQGYEEVRLAKIIHDRTGNAAPLVMAVRACKENIDRGGMENTKYLYLRLADDINPQEKAEIIAGAFESRAMSARDRLILEARTPQCIALMRNIKPSDYGEDIFGLVEKEGVIKPPEFRPAMSEIDEPLVLNRKSKRKTVQDKTVQDNNP